MISHEDWARRCINVVKSGIDERVLVPNIVEALRTVERQAYERAARTIETRAGFFADDDHPNWIIEDLASSIRALAAALHDKGSE